MAHEIKECPFCAETIKASAKKCRFCGEFLEGYTRADILAILHPRIASPQTLQHIIDTDTPVWLEDAAQQDETPFTQSRLVQYNIALQWDGEANLSSFNLSKCDLTSAQLENANITNTNLRRAILSQAHLSGAILKNADLSEAELIKTDMRGANLYNANLSATDLLSAELQDSDLRFANLKSAYMLGAELQGARLRQAILSGARELNYRQLMTAHELQGAILPDGERYNGRFNLPGDLERARAEGLDTQDAADMAQFYGVSLNAYVEGQQSVPQS